MCEYSEVLHLWRRSRCTRIYTTLRSATSASSTTLVRERNPRIRSAAEVEPTKAIEIEKKRIMAENMDRMTEVLQTKAPSLGLNQQDFSEVARTFVYGAAQKGTHPNKKRTDLQKNEGDTDPTYEPDAAEMANADDELATDDMAVDEPIIVRQQKCSKVVVPASNIATRSRSTHAPEVDGITEGEMSATHIVTSNDINSPDTNQLGVQQGVMATSSRSKRKRGGRRPTMGHGLHEYTRRIGGNKMEIEFTASVRRPKNHVHAAKLSSECGVHIRSKMPIATHRKLYTKDDTPKHVIPDAIKSVAGKFVMDKNDEVAKEICTDIIQSCVRQHRYRLKRAYWDKIKNLTPEQAYLLKPHNVEDKSWEELVNKWFDEHYQEMCEKNKVNREGVKKKHTTGSRSYIAHYEHVNALNEEQEISPIEFYRITHTNKYGLMTDDAQTVYDEMVNRRLAPAAEDEAPKTDVQIVEELLKEQSSSSTGTSTFLTRSGLASSSRKNSISATRIRELEERLANQEQQSVLSSERYQQHMEARMQAQELKFEDMRRKQEELAALKKAQDENTRAYEKKHQEMEALLSYLLRTSQQPSQGNFSAPPPS